MDDGGTHEGLPFVGPKGAFGPRGLLCNAKGFIVCVMLWSCDDGRLPVSCERLGTWRIVTTWVTLLEKKASSVYNGQNGTAQLLRRTYGAQVSHLA